jgi:hypothetical protein
MNIDKQQETIGQLIIKGIKQYLHCNKLRDRLLFYCLLGLLINFFVFINAYQRNAIILFPALLIWFFISGISTYLVYRQITAKIIGNVYKEIQAGLKKRILILGISFIILFFLQKIEIADIYYYSFLAIPITLSFFIATAVTLIWLIDYESKNGDVFIVIDRKK